MCMCPLLDIKYDNKIKTTRKGKPTVVNHTLGHHLEQQACVIKSTEIITNWYVAAIKG